MLVLLRMGRDESRPYRFPHGAFDSTSFSLSAMRPSNTRQSPQPGSSAAKIARPLPDSRTPADTQASLSERHHSALLTRQSRGGASFLRAPSTGAAETPPTSRALGKRKATEAQLSGPPSTQALSLRRAVDLESMATDSELSGLTDLTGEEGDTAAAVNIPAPHITAQRAIGVPAGHLRRLSESVSAVVTEVGTAGEAMTIDAPAPAGLPPRSLDLAVFAPLPLRDKDHPELIKERYALGKADGRGRAELEDTS